MNERMTAADVASLLRESRTAPQHIGGLAVFTMPAGGFDYDRLVRLLEERIALVPRYRQKVRTVPGNLAYPMWVDDTAFDITYHVRRTALPRPGTDRQLLDFGARIQSRLLDRARPLWEMYLVEGLAGGRVAIVTKTHAAMIDGQAGVDLAQVILDAAPEPRRTVGSAWHPAPEPRALSLVLDALFDLVRHPPGPLDAWRIASGAVGWAGSLARDAVTEGRSLWSRPGAPPLRAALGEQRRLALARTRLADYRRVRDVFGGTVHDVVLAVIAGALRGWLLARGEEPDAESVVRALVPVSVVDAADAGDAGDAGDADGPAEVPTRIRPLLVDLPVGEPDPVVRAARVRSAMVSHEASGRAVAADRIAALAGFAPPTVHALGARAAAELSRRLYAVVVTNVPGPQVPLYAAGAQLVEMFPILPIAAGQMMSIALTSYDGGVYFGINGDRDALPDAALVAELIEEALAELVAAAGGPRGKRAARTPAARATTKGGA